MNNKQKITLFSRDYKELLKFRTFVKTYYPNYHICPKCGELMPENNICLRCYINADLELCKQIKLIVNNSNSIKK